MNLTALFFIVLLSLTRATEKPDHWVVLVAGSKGFWNYRHQADICHAYQIMKDNGVPEEQIIVFSYDDVAHDSQNPFPGKLFNKKDGHDVYEGCKIDYRGEDVTSTKFLSILRGEGDGKTLKTDENSKVFINFADHGAPGLIAFPNDELHARDFHKTLHEMHSDKKYGKMIIYIEACESGSMFEDILEDNINVYATTAADSHESSWAYYCAPDDTVDGVSIGSWLGDEYSIHWMEDSDENEIVGQLNTFDINNPENKIWTTTIGEQVDKVKHLTKNSKVQEFGDFSYRNEFVGNFQGVWDSKQTVKALLKTLKNTYEPKQRFNGMDSRFAKMDYLYNKFKSTQTDEDAKALEKEIELRRKIEERFGRIRNNVNFEFKKNPKVENYNWYRSMVNAYKQNWGMEEYDLAFLHHFASLCNSNLETEQILNLVTSHC